MKKNGLGEYSFNPFFRYVFFILNYLFIFIQIINSVYELQVEVT